MFSDIRRSEELSLLKPIDEPKKKKKKDKGAESAIDEILNMDIASGMAGGIYLLYMAMRSLLFVEFFYYNEKTSINKPKKEKRTT